MKLTKLTLILTLSLISTSVFAELNIPRVINFQSVLRDDAGNLLPDTTTALEFRILDADGTQLYFETQAEVPVTRGAVNAMIGEGDFPGTNTPTGGIPLNALDPTTGEKLLQYRIGNNESVDPIEFGLVPYAFWSEKSLSVVNDAIGSAQIKNGSIKLEDLEPGTISFGDVGGMVGVAQIPVSIARYSDLTSHINNPTSAHRASAIVVDGLLSRIPATINNVQGVLVELARLLNDEISQRQTLDTNFANHISAGNSSAHSFSNISGTISNAQIADGAVTASKLANGAVSTSSLANGSITGQKLDYTTGPSAIDDRYVNVDGDTMTNTLNMGGHNITNAGNFITNTGVNLNNHEERLIALGGRADSLRTVLTTAGNIQPDIRGPVTPPLEEGEWGRPGIGTCAWSLPFQEKAGVFYICPEGKVMVGREHEDDENGGTRYYCCSLYLSIPSVPITP